MSKAGLFSDYIKSLPLTTSTTEKTVLLANNGGMERISFGAFARQASVSVQGGDVVRISNIMSAFIAVRSTLNTMGALLWVSSYLVGQPSRTIAKKFYSHANYSWYINGSSDSQAAVYLTNIGTPTNERVVVTSLFGEQPIIEKVTAVPADATPLTFI